MKLSAIVCVLALTSVAVAHPSFEAWMKEHNKVYGSVSEVEARRAVYTDNLKLVAEIQANDIGATYGMTEFADLTTEEFAARYLSPLPFDSSIVNEFQVAEPITGDVPDEFDWTTKDAVNPVKNQGQCGSCWAFSATAAMETAWFLAGNDLVSLSEQELVDCDHECMEWEGQQACDGGCNGGLMMNAFNYLIKNGGQMTEDDYPYKGYGGECQFDASKVVAKPTNWTYVTESKDEDAMKAFVAEKGVVSIAVNAGWLQFYFGGVSHPLICSPKHLDHGVAIVGYGVSGSKPFWKVRNSWGGSWGEHGYFRIYRGKNVCGVAEVPCAPIV